MTLSDTPLPSLPLTAAQVTTFAMAHDACNWARERLRAIFPGMHGLVHADTADAREQMYDAAIRGDLDETSSAAAQYKTRVIAACAIRQKHERLHTLPAHLQRVYNWPEAEDLGAHVIELMHWKDTGDIAATEAAATAYADAWHTAIARRSTEAQE